MPPCGKNGEDAFPRYLQQMKTRNPALLGWLFGSGEKLDLIFDIVNGFLIDAVAHRVHRLRSLCAHALLQMYIWLRLLSAPCERHQGLCKPDVDGVDSQA